MNCIKADLSVTFCTPSDGLAEEHGKKTGSLEASKPEWWWITLSDNEPWNMTVFGNGFSVRQEMSNLPLFSLRRGLLLIACFELFFLIPIITCFDNRNRVYNVMLQIIQGETVLRGRTTYWNPRPATILRLVSKECGWLKATTRRGS